jgi:DNA-binding CsgD family transcriptional regulator
MPQRGAPVEPDGPDLASIYASALAADPWRDAIEMIADRLGVLIAGISFRVAREGQPTIGVQAFRGEGLRIWNAFFSRFRHMIPFDYDNLEVGTLYPLARIAGNEDARLRLRAELLDPGGAGESWCMPLGLGKEAIAYLILVMPHDAELTQELQDWCYGAAPHLARAVDGYQRMRQAELASALAGDALGHLTIGVAAIDRNDRILFTNSEADRIIAASPDLGRHDGHLVAVGHVLTDRFVAARTVPQAVRIRGGDEAAVGMLIIPVEAVDELGPGSPPERALYFHDLAAAPRISERLVAELFGLSLAEARLSALLAQGLTLREAAGAMGVTENTARTYSKLVYSKLGISRQVDLVRVLLRSVAMLGSGE